MFLVCERWVEDGDRLLFWSKVLLTTIAALLLHPGWAAQPWITEGPKPLSLQAVLTLASCLQLTQTVCVLVILLFNAHLLPLFSCLFTRVHLLIDGSVEGQSITHGVKQCALTTMILPTTVDTALVIWCTYHKLACTKILQNFWFTIVSAGAIEYANCISAGK